MEICWIGLDLLDTGGISTYSRYVVKTLNELKNDKFYLTSIINLSYSKNRTNFELKTDKRITYCEYRKTYQRIIALFKSFNKIYKSEVIILNHISLFLFAIVAFILRKKIIVFGYNNDITFVKGLRKNVLTYLVNKIIVDSTYTQKTLKRKFNITSKLLFDPIEKVGNKKKDIDFSGYCSERKMKLITIAVLRMSQNKGHRQVFEALKELRGLHIKYLIVGDGPDYNNLKNIVDKYNINDLVEFKGYVSEREKYELMESSDIAILISKQLPLLGEGLPLGLIEAGALGNAIIGGNEDGTVDAIDSSNPNGFLINPYKIKDLVKIINTYYFDNELLERHKKNSIHYCKENFIYEKFKTKLKSYLMEYKQ